MIKALIYLWSIDAYMPLNEDTEKYLRDQLVTLKESEYHCYLDKRRVEMVDRLMVELS